MTRATRKWSCGIARSVLRSYAPRRLRPEFVRSVIKRFPTTTRSGRMSGSKVLMQLQYCDSAPWFYCCNCIAASEFALFRRVAKQLHVPALLFAPQRAPPATKYLNRSAREQRDSQCTYRALAPAPAVDKTCAPANSSRRSRNRES